MKSSSKNTISVRDKKLFIFDFDGTIAETTPLHAQAFVETLAPLGIKVDYARLAGRKTADALLLCFAGASLPVPDAETLAVLVAEKQRRVRALIATSLNAIIGVNEFLHCAKPCYKMALVTSGSRGTVELALEKLGYMGWFSPILFAEDVHAAKPDPEGFLSVLKLTEVPPKEALVFEDSEAGFDAAKAANIDFLDARKLDWLLLKSLIS